ncbi:MAG: secretin N-terminal domain-containing protein, partial [Planctomycetota bacterium]
MNRVNISKIIFCFMIFSVCLGTSQLVQAASDVPLAVGRDNPFADIPRPLKPVVNPVVDPTEAMAEAPDLFVGTATLKFLDAENLKDAVKMMSSPWGSIAVNAKNNSLIVCDTKERLARIISEIKKADKTPPQIVIEVVILDVQLTDDTEMGINWDILSDKRYDIGYRQNFTTSRLLSTVEDADTIGDASAFNTRGLGGDFSIISGTVRNVVH